MRPPLTIYFSDRFVLPLPEWHRFPMAKYAKLRERVERESLVNPERLREPPAATLEQLRLAHEDAYLDRVFEGRLRPDEARGLGFPWSPELVERSRRSVGATVEAARNALAGDFVGVNLAGGTHHASRDRCAGYCVFNDAAVAARTMQREGRARRVLIADCDVHQGDGSALIFRDDPSVFTFSIHGASNYPLTKPPSDLDVALPDRTTDEAYLEALRPALDDALKRSQPDLAFYIAGADPYHGDRFGRLALTPAGLAARDRHVFETLRRADVPVAVSMAGGYAENVDQIVAIHFETVRIAVQTARSSEMVDG